jgi:hypothetical protein
MNGRTSLKMLVAGMFVLFSHGLTSGAGEPGYCGHCGEKLVCQVMCETKTISVLRYKVESHEHAPPDDRWILGCCKPIRIISLVPHEEVRKFPVRQFAVYKCPRCEPPLAPPVPSVKGEAAAPKRAALSIAD